MIESQQGDMMVFNYAQKAVKLTFLILILMVGVVMAPNLGGSPELATMPQAIAKQVNIDAKQLHCMAKNIFYEAGSESINGQAAVARVVLNRVAHGFSKSVCGVVYQSTTVNENKVCQFSWVCENKPDPKHNDYRYLVAKQVAYDVMVENKYKDVLPKSALFFHNLNVNPLWPHAQVAKIGNHVFYERSKKKRIVPKRVLNDTDE